MTATATSKNIRKEARAPNGNEGTAKAMANAMDEADEEIWLVEKYFEKITDQDEIRVWTAYTSDMDEKPVPKPLHKLLTGWGWEPVEGHGTTVREQHVYRRR